MLLSPEQLLEEASRIEEWEAVGDSRADFEFGGESAADTEAMVLALERDQRVSPKGCLGDFTTTKVRSNPKRVTCNCQIFTSGETALTVFTWRFFTGTSFLQGS